MSEAKARELREMVAAWRSKWPDADVIPLAEIELYAANLAAVPAPPAEPTLGEAHPFSYVGEDECGYCNLPREHPIHWRAAKESK